MKKKMFKVLYVEKSYKAALVEASSPDAAREMVTACMVKRCQMDSDAAFEVFEIQDDNGKTVAEYV